jgi:hypothetical protein
MNGREIPCVFQVPLTYGPRRPDKCGAEVEPEVMLRIVETVWRQFGGYSPLGRIKGGTWFDEETGRQVSEDQERWEVWVTQDRISVLREVVYSIGKELGQKEMFLIIPEAVVDRLRIQDSGTDLAANG